MRPLAPRERRLVAAGLLVAAIAAIWLALISPLIGGFQARAARREQLLARYQTNLRLLDSIPTLRAEATDLRRTAAQYQITAPTQALASQALKQRLAAALGDAGGVVGATQDVQAEVPSGWVSVRADAQINLTQLTQSIRRLENEAPYVVIEYASLGADRALQAGHAAPLDVRIQVSAPFHPAPAR
ncbi:MAG: type II secretion system protein GspM [Caulobacteraceae bacterium]|nr:type II secretion system protein GspM [Caulobacteraceae bacterium]